MTNIPEDCHKVSKRNLREGDLVSSITAEKNGLPVM